MHQRAKCSETGWGWEAEWGEYALRNAQIQMGVSNWQFCDIFNIGKIANQNVFECILRRKKERVVGVGVCLFFERMLFQG